MLQVNVARLHDDNRDALSLAWVAGREGGTAVRREAAPPATLVESATRTQTPLFTSPLPAPKVIEKLARYLAKLLAESTELHGVFMDVLGLGVLITGESGVGKSELGLELISRGHGLVADDVV